MSETLLKEQNMKLIKLSVAAVIAVGAMTTFASAAPLEEAIKGVDVSGMARYRFHHQSDLRYSGADAQRNRFSALLNVNAPIADGLTFGISLAGEGSNYSANSASGAAATEVDKFFFQYAADGLVLKAGKFEIPAPWTQAGYAGSRGNGVLVLYTPADLGWTFAGAYYNQVNGLNSGYIAGGQVLPGNVPGLGAFDGLFGQEDLFAVATIGAVGPVSTQLWASRMTNLFDVAVFGEANLKSNGFSLKGQANYLKLADEVAPLFADDAGLFYGVEGGFKADNFFVNLGYTANDKDQPVYALDADNDGFIKFGKQLYYITLNQADAKVFFGNAGFSHNKFGVAAGYGVADLQGGDVDEFYGLVSYKVAKNLGLELYYSILGSDNTAVTENNELRFQAQYNF
jgi:hypothetical protein